MHWRRCTAHRRSSGRRSRWLLLLAVNARAQPAASSRSSWRDGHLYGSLIDILNRAAPLMLVALGMTLVIATRGIDISVGAVVAIAAAVAACADRRQLVIVDGQQTYVTRIPMPLALLAALARGARCAACGTACWWPRVGIQPIIATLILMVAGRGIAQLITGGQIITIYYTPYFFIGSGYLLGLPFSLLAGRRRCSALMAWLKHAHRARPVHPGQSASTRRPRGWPASTRAALLVGVYAFCGLTAGLAGLMISSNVKSADGNNAGQLLELDAILAVTLGGTSLLGGRFSLRGSVLGALIIQTLTTTHLLAGRAARDQPGRQGGGGVRRDACCSRPSSAHGAAPAAPA